MPRAARRGRPAHRGPPDGVIVANELHVFLESVFSRLENQLGRAVQKPLLWSLDGREKKTVHLPDPGTPSRCPLPWRSPKETIPTAAWNPTTKTTGARRCFFGRNEVIEHINKQGER